MLRWLYRLADFVRARARARVWDPSQAIGRTAEDLAHRYLQGQGLIVISRNWRTPSGSGEVDLIARDGDTLVFVEVKSRTTDQVSAPDRAIDEEKRSRLRRAAWRYVDLSGHDRKFVRFDLINVVFEPTARISHWKDAFRVL
jgi:putative endonuclease